MRRPDAILLDLDGVLYVGEQTIPGARQAVAALRDAGYALRYVTNTTTRPRAATVRKLLRLGFAVTDGEVLTPAAPAVAYCRSRGHRRVALVMERAVREDFAALEVVDERADAVILGDLGTRFDYARLNHAFRLIMDGAELIALQKNRYWLTSDGLSLDAGAFVAALEYATGREAVVVGKPALRFFAAALDGLGVPAEAAVMIGDDVESDVGGALAAGLGGILVRTGKFREDRLRASGIAPTAVVDAIGDVPALLAGRPRP